MQICNKFAIAGKWNIKVKDIFDKTRTKIFEDEDADFKLFV